MTCVLRSKCRARSPLYGEEVFQETPVHGAARAPFSGVDEWRENGVEDARSRVDFVERSRKSVPRRCYRGTLERVLIIDPTEKKEW